MNITLQPQMITRLEKLQDILKNEGELSQEWSIEQVISLAIIRLLYEKTGVID